MESAISQTISNQEAIPTAAELRTRAKIKFYTVYGALFSFSVVLILTLKML